MATPQSPFSFLDGLFERVAAGPQPPEWLVHEVQQRMVLFLNHVLMQVSGNFPPQTIRSLHNLIRTRDSCSIGIHDVATSSG